MDMDSYDGLGKNRKFGFDKEDGPNKRAIDIDSILEKLETQLKKKPERDVLVKCQNILDKLADKYNGKCTKKQLSRMYKIQGKIFEYSGEKKLAKRYRYQAQESRKDYGLRRALFIIFIIVGFAIAVICFIVEQNNVKIRTKADLDECLGLSSAAALFNGDTSNGINKEQQYQYIKSKNEHSIECYRKYKVEDSEAEIKKLQSAIDDAKVKYLREEEEQKKNSEYLQQYMLEKQKNNIHCNTTYSGRSSYTDCY